MPQPTETQITAEIRRHEFQIMGDLTILKGFVYGDKNGRFRDGEYIRTSSVKDIKGDLVFTENSTYRVIN